MEALKFPTPLDAGQYQSGGAVGGQWEAARATSRGLKWLDKLSVRLTLLQQVPGDNLPHGVLLLQTRIFTKLFLVTLGLDSCSTRCGFAPSTKRTVGTLGVKDMNGNLLSLPPSHLGKTYALEIREAFRSSNVVSNGWAFKVKQANQPHSSENTAAVWSADPVQQSLNQQSNLLQHLHKTFQDVFQKPWKPVFFSNCSCPTNRPPGFVTAVRVRKFYDKEKLTKGKITNRRVVANHHMRFKSKGVVLSSLRGLKSVWQVGLKSCHWFNPNHSLSMSSGHLSVVSAQAVGVRGDGLLSSPLLGEESKAGDMTAPHCVASVRAGEQRRGGTRRRGDVVALAKTMKARTNYGRSREAAAILARATSRKEETEPVTEPRLTVNPAIWKWIVAHGSRWFLRLALVPRKRGQVRCRHQSKILCHPSHNVYISQIACVSFLR